MKFEFKAEINKLWGIIKSLDKKVVVIFIAVAVFQTISWYYTSRGFFRRHLYYTVFKNDPNVNLYEYLFWFVSELLPFFILPYLTVKFLLREKISNYGVRFGDWKTGLKLSLLFMAVMIPILWFASSQPEFVSKYPHLRGARESWTIFFVYETGMLIYMFSWEFFWRGFMLFGLEEKFGYYAVLIQMIPFVILHNGKPEIETFSAILGGIALGILAFRTRSFIYGIIVHIFIMSSIDFISALRFRTGSYGVGFDAIGRLISKLF